MKWSDSSLKTESKISSLKIEFYLIVLQFIVSSKMEGPLKISSIAEGWPSLNV